MRGQEDWMRFRTSQRTHSPGRVQEVASGCCPSREQSCIWDCDDLSTESTSGVGANLRFHSRKEGAGLQMCSFLIQAEHRNLGGCIAMRQDSRLERAKVQPGEGSPSRTYHTGWRFFKLFHLEHCQGVVEAELAEIWSLTSASTIKKLFYLVFVFYLVWGEGI